MIEALLRRHAELRADLEAAYGRWPWDTRHIDRVAAALLGVERRLQRVSQAGLAIISQNTISSATNAGTPSAAHATSQRQ